MHQSGLCNLLISTLPDSCEYSWAYHFQFWPPYPKMNPFVELSWTTHSVLCFTCTLGWTFSILKLQCYIFVYAELFWPWLSRLLSMFNSTLVLTIYFLLLALVNLWKRLLSSWYLRIMVSLPVLSLAISQWLLPCKIWLNIELLQALTVTFAISSWDVWAHKHISFLAVHCFLLRTKISQLEN